jgi:hypothetical protein
MPGASRAPRVSKLTFTGTGTTVLENGESVVIHGFTISSAGFNLLRLEDANGNIIGDTGADLVIIDSTDNRTFHIPALYQNGFAINVIFFSSPLHVTVYHEAGGG